LISVGKEPPSPQPSQNFSWHEIPESGIGSDHLGDLGQRNRSNLTPSAFEIGQCGFDAFAYDGIKVVKEVTGGAAKPKHF
jgi:hypothetical protein